MLHDKQEMDVISYLLIMANGQDRGYRDRGEETISWSIYEKIKAFIPSGKQKEYKDGDVEFTTSEKAFIIKCIKEEQSWKFFLIPTKNRLLDKLEDGTDKTTAEKIAFNEKTKILNIKISPKKKAK